MELYSMRGICPDRKRIKFPFAAEMQAREDESENENAALGGGEISSNSFCYSGAPYPPPVGVMTVKASPASSTVWSQLPSTSTEPFLRRTSLRPV